MVRYVAFLRAINVGGHRIIKMEVLRGLFEDMKFKNVVTYIQSGNVLFSTTAKNENALVQKIEKQIASTIGFEVEVFIRSLEEIEKIVASSPYIKQGEEQDTGTYVTLLAHEANSTMAATLTAMNNDVDEVHIKGRDIYLLRYRNRGKETLTHAVIEKKLKQKGTNRNMTTMQKLLSL
ncbi:MAG: DUF1697 domain-containing protein [Taibaiella sp.]|nr:DUF1697 domain-containing protein [Taibaiella sp.]